MKQNYIYAIMTSVALASTSPNVSLAHSGGLNAEGCHAGSKPYHCHRSSSARKRSATGDRNCSDFTSWRAAQSFYEQAGRGDPHKLDADKDGIACENLR